MTSTQQLASRLDNFLSRRNDKIYVAVQSLTVLLYLALNGRNSSNDGRVTIQQLRCKYLKKMLEVGCDSFTYMWKNATCAIANAVSQNILETATRYGNLSSEEKEIYEDLMNIYDRPIENERPTEEEFYFFSYISQSRFLPLPSMKATAEKLTEYIQGLVMDRDPEYFANAHDAGRILSDHIRKMALKQNKTLFQQTHLSLSNGSCWEASRSDSGKWHVMLPQSELIEFLQTPVGNYFHEIDGSYYDMYNNIICAEEYGCLPIWQIAYLEEPLSGNFGDVYVIHENLGTQFDKGFDARLGLLLFLWASLKKQDFDDSGIDTINSKLIIIGEPGCKIRPLTASETWAYLYMVPAMHLLKEAVECLPGARIGLTEHDNLWRFGTSYKNHYSPEIYSKVIPEFISSSDLSSATDKFGHRLASSLLKGLVWDSDASQGTKAYMAAAIELCCSPRRVHYKATNRLARKLVGKIPQVDYADSRNVIAFTSQCGVMMGDPITKVILTASSMASWVCTQAGFNHLREVNFEEYMRRTYINRHLIYKTPGASFACAGDDHTAVGSERDVRRPPEFLQSMNLEISWNKYCISRKYVSYCQAFGYAPRFDIGIHRDTIKVRLLNEFRKQGGHDSYEEPDPLVGKARDLERSVRQIGNEEYKHFVQGVIPPALRAGMPRWFETKVYKKYQTYMPSSFGGLGIPSRVDWIIDEKSCSLYKTYCLNHQPGLLKTPAKHRAWHRGQEFNEQLTTVGGILGGKSFEEAWDETVSRLDSGMTTASGAKRIQRQILYDYVRIDEPCTVIGTKESAPAEVYNQRASPKMVKPFRRSRQILNQKARLYHINRELVDSIPYSQVDMENLHKKRPGLWVEREVLQSTLGIRFSAPRLSFATRLFDGMVGNFVYDLDPPSYGDNLQDPVESVFEFDYEDLSNYSNYWDQDADGL